MKQPSPFPFCTTLVSPGTIWTVLDTVWWRLTPRGECGLSILPPKSSPTNEAIGRTLSEVVSVSISAPELIRDGRANVLTIAKESRKSAPRFAIRRGSDRIGISIGAMADHSRDCK